MPHQVKVAGNLEEEKDEDALWLEVIKEEQNPTYKKLNSYFIQNKEAQKNDYTGYFKGKNVIVIMMESANYAIDNAEYFPNFTRMLKIVGIGLITIVQNELALPPTMNFLALQVFMP